MVLLHLDHNIISRFFPGSKMKAYDQCFTRSTTFFENIFFLKMGLFIIFQLINKLNFMDGYSTTDNARAKIDILLAKFWCWLVSWVIFVRS